METDNLKLTITVDGSPVYFGAPVFYEQKTDGDGVSLIMRTEVGNQVKQTMEIVLKKPTYIESALADSPKTE